MMTSIVGQEKLIQRIDSLDLSTTPRTILLEGELGSGRHTLCAYLANHLDIEAIDITGSLDLETIAKTYEQVKPYLYIIDTQSITVREENIILKFLEEPLKNAFVVLVCENKDLLLDTIVNRCVQWKFDTYSRDTLLSFCGGRNNVDAILDMCTTPGQILSLQDDDFDGMSALANKILDNIGRATLPNTLSLLNQVTFKSEKGKYDFHTFSKFLLYSTYKKIKIGELDYKAYVLINDLQRKCSQRAVNNEYLFAEYLIDLRDLLWGKQ